MRGTSFDQYWSQNWKSSGQPQVFDAAMREVALKAWNAAIAAASTQLALGDSDIRLIAGEMNAGEMRTTKAVLAGCNSNVRTLILADGA